jgi:mitochondrial import inner membrane translocase subunit TIM50
LPQPELIASCSSQLEHGWRTAKRPGADYFLAYLSQFYEVVLFTTQPAYVCLVPPIRRSGSRADLPPAPDRRSHLREDRPLRRLHSLETLPRVHPLQEQDSDQGAYRLTAPQTQANAFVPRQDLSYLGRPLERTIILDTNPEHFQLQPENAIQLAPWTGKRDATAKELVSLIPFLEALAIRGVKDVRPVIKHYEGRHIPTAYAEAEAAQKKALMDKWEKDRESTVSTWISAALGSFTKVSSSCGSMPFDPSRISSLTSCSSLRFPSLQSRDTPPETDVEKVRKNAQRMYLEEQKYWKDNEEIIKKQMDDDREKQLKE